MAVLFMPIDSINKNLLFLRILTNMLADFFSYFSNGKIGMSVFGIPDEVDVYFYEGHARNILWLKVL